MSSLVPEIDRPLEVPDLIPARMLNEFTYCPRLAYLEWVQGEFANNLDTLEGTFGHRRVDRPTRADIPDPSTRAATARNTSTVAASASTAAADSDATAITATTPTTNAAAVTNVTNATNATNVTEAANAADADSKPIHARSLLLSAPGEGLIARLDLLELDGPTVTPVDYKHGAAPDIPEGAWEPERVQLCAQGLILREAGFHCDEGVLYYIDSRRRVVIPFDEPLVERTRELVAELRRTANAGVLPPPLVDSPKCPRCSLVGICLPDETNLLTHADAEPGEVRRLLPARDDALPLYVQEQGAMLGKDGDQLVIRRKSEVLHKVRLYNVSQVSLFGNVQISAQALREIAARGIPVCHFSYGGWFHALTAGHVHKNIELRIRQFAVAADAARSLPLARALIVGKIRNSRTMLRRHLPEDDRPEIVQLADLIQKAERAPTAETLLGLEGMAAKIYFSGFARLLKGGEAFEIEGRNRRPPRDPVNALLSFVYSLLAKELTIVLQAVGFDPLLGVFHRPRYGRPSLALDLAEEFRPLVADSTVLMLVNNGEVSADSFIRQAGAVALTTAGRKAVIAAFERRLDSEITHPLFGYRVSYRRILEVQSRLFARTLLGDLPEYPGFCTR